MYHKWVINICYSVSRSTIRSPTMYTIRIFTWSKTIFTIIFKDSVMITAPVTVLNHHMNNIPYPSIYFEMPQSQAGNALTKICNKSNSNVLTNSQYNSIFGKHIPGIKPCLSRNLFPNPCISQFLCALLSPLCTLHYDPQIRCQS